MSKTSTVRKDIGTDESVPKRKMHHPVVEAGIASASAEKREAYEKAVDVEMNALSELNIARFSAASKAPEAEMKAVRKAFQALEKCANDDTLQAVDDAIDAALDALPEKKKQFVNYTQEIYELAGTVADAALVSLIGTLPKKKRKAIKDLGGFPRRYI